MLNIDIKSYTQNCKELDNKTTGVFYIKERSNGNVFSTHSI
jgi:hypothetical protein